MFMPNMQHIGQLTGVGDAHVFGLARHLVDDDRADLIYLNMAGPVTSVESVWARLVEGGTVTFRGSDRSLTRHLRHHGLEDGAPFVRYQRRIPGLAIDHLTSGYWPQLDSRPGRWLWKTKRSVSISRNV